MLGDRIRGTTTRILAIAAPLVLIVAFQNCTSGKPVSLNNGSRTKTVAENGNGNGYGGMQYFAARSATVLCPDGSDVSSRIAVTNTQNTYLTRENCKEIAPTRVNVNFTATTEVPALSYEGKVFHGERVLPQQAATVPQAAERAPASATLDLSGNIECNATELGRADSKATIRLARRSSNNEGGRIYSHRGSLKVQTAGSIREYEGFRVERLAPLVLISEGNKSVRSLLVTLNGDQQPATGVMNFSVDGRTKTFRINGCH